MRLWLQRFVTPGQSVPTVELLQAINSAIKDDFTYHARFEEGTQSPARTLEVGSGTCRDFALLFIEAVRELGFAARFVTGYLYTRTLISTWTLGGSEGSRLDARMGRGLSARSGWIDFDPTNGLIGTDHLVRVAVVRDPRQASPSSAAFSPNGRARFSAWTWRCSSPPASTALWHRRRMPQGRWKRSARVRGCQDRRRGRDHIFPSSAPICVPA